MATAGPRSGGTFANDSSNGSTFPWDIPSRASASDNVRVQTSFDAEAVETSQYLKVTNFGFTIPDGATIDGILVEVERRYVNLGGANAIVDDSIKLVKGGTIQSTNKASGTPWSTTEAYASYGGAADLWGGTWTAADINASNFGVVVSCTDNASTGDVGQVDHIRITITYTEVVASTIVVTGTPGPPFTKTQDITVTGENYTAGDTSLTLKISGDDFSTSETVGTATANGSGAVAFTAFAIEDLTGLYPLSGSYKLRISSGDHPTQTATSSAFSLTPALGEMTVLEVFGYPDGSIIGQELPQYPGVEWEIEQSIGHPMSIVEGDARPYPHDTGGSDFYHTNASTFDSIGSVATEVGGNFVLLIGFTFVRSTTTNASGNVQAAFGDPHGHAAILKASLRTGGVDNIRIQLINSDPVPFLVDTTAAANEPHGLWFVVENNNSTYRLFLDGALIQTGTISEPDSPEDSILSFSAAEALESSTFFHLFAIDYSFWLDTPAVIFDGAPTIVTGDPFKAWAFRHTNSGTVTFSIVGATSLSVVHTFTGVTANSSGFKVSSLVMPDLDAGSYRIKATSVAGSSYSVPFTVEVRQGIQNTATMRARSARNGFRVSTDGGAYGSKIGPLRSVRGGWDEIT